MTHVVSDPRASVGIPRDPILGRRDSGTIYFVSKFGGVAVKKNIMLLTCGDIQHTLDRLGAGHRLRLELRHVDQIKNASFREVDRRQPASWFLIKEALKPEASCTLPETKNPFYLLSCSVKDLYRPNMQNQKRQIMYCRANIQILNNLSLIGSTCSESMPVSHTLIAIVTEVIGEPMLDYNQLLRYQVANAANDNRKEEVRKLVMSGKTGVRAMLVTQ
ncbi:hypothetical protein EDD22DRAFT_1046699 [Suillus occidentalis]|nr:hypothetical protein EDD22DRAFT_1046699 [Suillus occidentalis]